VRNIGENAYDSIYLKNGVYILALIEKLWQKKVIPEAFMATLPLLIAPPESVDFGIPSDSSQKHA
jgi:hypothetical protein